MIDWSVLAGVVLGGLLTIGAGVATEIVRARQEWNLDKEKRADDRQLAKNAFQRETLLRLQDALAVWARVTQERYTFDVRAWRETDRWHQTRAPEELAERERIANRELTILLSRVEDEALRNGAERCRQIEWEVAVSPDPGTADACNTALAKPLDWCLKESGRLARDLW